MMLKNLHNKIINGDSIKELRKIPDEMFPAKTTQFKDDIKNKMSELELIETSDSKYSDLLRYIFDYQ